MLCLLLNIEAPVGPKTRTWDQLAARNGYKNGSHPTVEEALERQELVLEGIFFVGANSRFGGVNDPKRWSKSAIFSQGTGGGRLRDRGSAETKTSGPLIISSVLGQASHRICSADCMNSSFWPAREARRPWGGSHPAAPSKIEPGFHVAASNTKSRGAA